MSLDEPQHVELTRLLREWNGGSEAAASEVLSMVYHRLRALAAGKLRAGAPQMSLEPTELANEVIANFLKADVAWEDRVHFFRAVGLAMRNFILDLARKQSSEKHGGGLFRVTLRSADEGGYSHDSDATALHQALTQLRGLYPRKADAVELNYLVGLEVEELAPLLGVSVATVNRDLRFARAWLKARLREA
jgi:RNA polymerase sigma factor (TIGR02999 family)